MTCSDNNCHDKALTTMLKGITGTERTTLFHYTCEQSTLYFDKKMLNSALQAFTQKFLYLISLLSIFLLTISLLSLLLCSSHIFVELISLLGFISLLSTSCQLLLYYSLHLFAGVVRATPTWVFWELLVRWKGEKR